MLFNIHTLKWDNELLKIFDIPASLLPEVKSSSEVYGKTVGLFHHPYLLPVLPATSRQHFRTDVRRSRNGQEHLWNGLLHDDEYRDQTNRIKEQAPDNCRWKIGNKTTYALEGSIFIGGAVVQWLRDSLGIIRNRPMWRSLLQSQRQRGCLFCSGICGAWSPYWNQHALGTITGLTRGSTSAHIARAALDSIAYQTLEVLLAMKKIQALI